MRGRAADVLLVRAELLHRIADGAAHLTHSRTVDIQIGQWIATLGSGSVSATEPIQSAVGQVIGELRVDGATEARQRALLRTLGLQIGPLLVDWPSPWWGDEVSAVETSAYVCDGDGGARWVLTLVQDNGRATIECDAALRRPIDLFAKLVVANAAHELRSPLTAVKMHADVAAEMVEGDHNAPPRSFLDVISTEADRMGGLLDNLGDAAWNPRSHTIVHRRR